jgi:hypothetical protein
MEFVGIYIEIGLWYNLRHATLAQSAEHPLRKWSGFFVGFARFPR